MIDIFSMNLAGNTSGLKLSGNSKATGNSGDATDSLFGLLLQNINAAQQSNSTSPGLSFLTDSPLADITSKDNSTGPEGIAIDNLIGKNITKSSTQSSDLTLSDTAVPQLISFLKGKGFSTEQTDRILFSSRNNEGLIQINKLVLAINASRKGSLSNDSGLVIEASSISKVQELLFKMGMGVGEVKETIEKSINQKGELSLDKLSDALKGQPQGSFSKSDLVSLLNQNAINIISKDQSFNTFKADLKSQSDPVSLSARDDISLKSQIVDTDTRDVDQKKEFVKLVENPAQALQATKEQKLSEFLKAKGIPEKEITSFLKTMNNDLVNSNVVANDSTLLDQISLKASAGEDLKKAFASLIENPAQTLQTKDKQNLSALLTAKGMPENEIKSFLQYISVDSSSSKVAAQATMKDSDLLSQISLKDPADKLYALLTAKGMPENEIKSFLQYISVDSSSSKVAAQATLKDSDLLSQISLKDPAGKLYALLTAKGMPENEIKSFLQYISADSSSSKVAAQATLKDSDLLSQISLKAPAGADLKNVFDNLIKNPSQTLQETDKQNLSALLKADGMPENEIKSFLQFISADSSSTKVAAQITAKDINFPDQATSKDQPVWLKNNESNIDDTLDGGDLLNARASDKGFFKEKGEMLQTHAELLKQGDQKIKQGILSDPAIVEKKTISQTEKIDNKDGLFNIKDTSIIDLTPQNMARVSTNVEMKSQLKGAYNLPEPLPKVFDRMVLMVKNGEQTGKLVIQQPELGKIDINLSIKDGHIQANLSTQTIAVKEIIETNLNHLKQQLTDQGLIVEQFNVSVGSGHKQFGEGNNWAWNNSHGSSQSGSSDTGDAPFITNETSGTLSSQYRIDVHV